jgi:2-polyprenyl-3-methyl-5-hydroxy-6-metoxy-1,4-benzoquinol methylase
MDDGSAAERDAIVARLALRTNAAGSLSGPCIPVLFEHYWEKVLRLFETIDKPLLGDRLTQFKDALRMAIERGFRASPYAQFVLNYRPAPAAAAEIQCEISLAIPTLEQEYQRWLRTKTNAAEMFGNHADAKVIDVATRLRASRETGGAAVRVLDVGAGTGRNAIALAQLGLEVDAIEPVRGLADVLTTEATRRGVAVNVIQRDVLQADAVLEEGRYALIVLSEVVTHLSYDQLAVVIPKLASRLTADGTLLFNTFISRDGYRPGPVAIEVAQVVWSTFFSREQLAALAARAGLRLVQEDACLPYEQARQPADEWPPTAWYVGWAHGHNLFDESAGPAPIELYWLEYQRSPAP